MARPCDVTAADHTMRFRANHTFSYIDMKRPLKMKLALVYYLISHFLLTIEKKS